VDIITLDDETGTFPAEPQYSFTHPYPCTKILFIPDKECTKEAGRGPAYQGPHHNTSPLNVLSQLKLSTVA